jgi:hypothetical protein
MGMLIVHSNSFLARATTNLVIQPPADAALVILISRRDVHGSMGRSARQVLKPRDGQTPVRSQIALEQKGRPCAAGYCQAA